MAEAEAAPEAQPKKKSKLKLIIILGLLLALSGGGVGAWLVFGRSGGAAGAEAKGEHGAEGGKAAEGRGEDAGEKGRQESGSDTEGGVIALESFIVNLSDAAGDRFLKVTVKLAMDDKEKCDLVKADELAIIKVRDRVLSILSSKLATDLASAEGRDHLRDEIRTGVNEVLLHGKISAVYFTEFILQ